MRTALRKRLALVATGVSLAALLGVNSVAQASPTSGESRYGGARAVAAVQASPYERGPAPTEAGVTASRGPFAISQVTVPEGSGTGFKNGTIYYPTSTAEGTFGAVAVIPGFVSPQAVIQWLGPRLASQGFVVFTLDTFSGQDFPQDRAKQLLAALDYLTTSSSVKNRIDPNRLAVMGHSMGGGASLWASANRPSLKAAVPLAPWEVDTTWEKADKVPTLIIGGQSDAIAPVDSMSIPFFTGIAASEKAYLELRNGDHFVPAAEGPVVAKYAISWLKRFVDLDTRYDQFLCPAPAPNTNISQYRDTCPHS
ncbi:dienelactone hydrolase family protein [Streptomyces spongiae]|uniref:Alpha/beta hydrolase n=1 Tax=Streptomyces spongiae TaxID=565072 RepID=A0A5N8XXT1_9ACTN|nr:dienelactone hydrolase family protein [Streptomyces spongiae]MPY63515.1 alpha/beta hydrolase [Streptomyces spongiae]